MNDRPNGDGVPLLSASNGANYLRANSAILTLKIPDVEEIAQAIWQRQHDALDAGAILHNVEWRDQSVPSKFWDEYFLDAQVILMLLYKKHIEYQNTGV
jgi:hypothetical protein